MAIVKGIPDGNVSEAELKHAVLQQVAAGGLKKTPGRGTKKFEELQDKALEELLNAVWVRGEGEELGIEITPKQIATELATIKKQNFKTEAAFQKFLKTSHYTKKDVTDRVRLQVLGTQIQERISKKAPPPTEAEVSDYYDSVKATQYTTKPSRNVRVVITEKEGDAKKAQAILVKDNSEGSWKKVAAKYSTDPTSKAKGGLLERHLRRNAAGTAQSRRLQKHAGRSDRPDQIPEKLHRASGRQTQPGKSAETRRSQRPDQKPAGADESAERARRIPHRLPEQVAVAHLLR